jgi:type II restriction/modification system DNA methylase subunit YeeA
VLGFLNSSLASWLIKVINPSIHSNPGDILRLPFITILDEKLIRRAILIVKDDWDREEYSKDFSFNPLVFSNKELVRESIFFDFSHTNNKFDELCSIEKRINKALIDYFGVTKKISEEVEPRLISLSSNPSYVTGKNLSFSEREEHHRSVSIINLFSYAVGNMMARYSLDKLGLMLASQGETLQDYLSQIPSPRFMPDDDAILPLTDQEWFADDATNRFREFVRVVWGDEHLQENLDFVAESLCLHAIKAKRGESALDTIRRYLSTQFYKDHMRTYKKRPIYWLFSSGKHKAFECLVYLHRYNEGTLARMRTEYVIPLTAKLTAYADKLEQDKAASASAAETKRLEKEIATLHKQQAELAEFDEKLRHFADQRISLDLDDGVKVNYGKFGDLLANVKEVTGKAPS